jgi:hypothetical protein
MSHKKQILRRVALFAGAAFVASGFGLLGATRHAMDQRESEKARQLAAERQRLDQARSYLAQVARRIVRLPVDPAVPGEVQSKYFEDYREGPMYVWATGTKGEFLFGVPSDAFARLNAAYDRYRLVIEKDAYYADRQAFLRQLAGHEDIDFGAVVREDAKKPESDTGLEPEPDSESATRAWRFHRESEEEWHVFSVPIRAESGTVLGNLYLKLHDRHRWDQGPPRDELLEGLTMGLAVSMALSGLFLWFLLPTWVYVDARERGVPRAMLWSLLALISLFVGLIVYLIARPDQTKSLQCPGCGREVNGGAFCPHCGRDLSTAFCSSCRYPLKPDWAFCPACRTEIKPQAAPAPPSEATGAPGA